MGVVSVYNIGDYIMKPSNGVCEIKDIVEREFMECRKQYYQLEPLADRNAVLYVPVDKMDQNVRAVMTEEEANALINRIPSIKESWVNNEKERERRYKDAIRSNDPDRLIGMIKLIYLRKKARQEQGKKTTVVDGRYFEMAEKLLYSELEFVMCKSRDEVHELICKRCEKTA